jgi:hypothetical protein
LSKACAASPQTPFLKTQAMLKTNIGPYSKTQVFDVEAPLYKKINEYLNFRTWGMRRKPLSWLQMKEKLSRLSAGEEDCSSDSDSN